MSMEIMTDPRVRSVEWRDLVKLSPREITYELLIFAPWLTLSLYFAHIEYYIPALFASFMLFLVGLRQVHNAYHYALGIPRWCTEWVIFFNSLLMMGSMHAVQLNHLRHHKHCMDDEDVEAMSAKMPWWQALLLGPIFPLKLHIAAFQHSTPRQIRWICAELLANIVWIYLVFFAFDIAVLQYHIIVMSIGQCFTGFFAVWTVHHDCDRSHIIARTLRNRYKNFVSYNMFYHIEHHLFPKVPTCHLPQLAKRLDKAAPELSQKQVF